MAIVSHLYVKYYFVGSMMRTFSIFVHEWCIQDYDSYICHMVLTPNTEYTWNTAYGSSIWYMIWHVYMTTDTHDAIIDMIILEI